MQDHPNRSTDAAQDGELVTRSQAESIPEGRGNAGLSDTALGSRRSPRVHRFAGLTSGEVYDRTQTDDSIRDGDVLVIPPNSSEDHEGLVAVLISAWPTVVRGGNPDATDHKLHTFEPGAVSEFLDREPQYHESFTIAALVEIGHAPLSQLRATAAMRGEDYRIARKHADEAAARTHTPEDEQAWRDAEAWAQDRAEAWRVARVAVIEAVAADERRQA